ncbi:MAG: HlyD family efflux transporter periplasmic adaptor subunit [Gammaproteobacteria bacterium]|nr:HlyD family efflux transporter periplasmic adaptor subunit [Gammaproteobacteria bacterium]
MSQANNSQKDDATNKKNARQTANSAQRKRFVLWLIILLVVASVLAFLLRPQALEVDMHEIRPQSLLVGIDEEGQTRVHDVYTFSAPVAGKLDRIELEVGDSIKANHTSLAVIHPQSPTFLDVRSEKQVKAAIDTAISARKFALAELARMRSDLDFAKSEYERALQLRQRQVIPVRQLDDAEHNYKAAQAALNSARAAVQMRSYELKQAEAMLLTPADATIHGENCECVPLTSPINGKVLKVYDHSSRSVATGEPLIDIGDASDLEIVVDLLSADAVQVQAGGRVIINDWGGEGNLEGRVRRVEPFGFTKVSALGIEEQRVNVVIDIVTPGEQWQRLGHGYQVGLSVVLWEADNVLTVPLTATFRKKLSLDKDQKDAWAVFVVEQGKVRHRDIQIGQRSGLDAEVVSGLVAGEKVVLHPSNKIMDGVRVSSRTRNF